jgi:hypothetical protein
MNIIVCQQLKHLQTSEKINSNSFILHLYLLHCYVLNKISLVIATLLCTTHNVTCNCYIAMYSTRFHLYLLHCYVLHKWSLVIATLLCTQQDLLDEAIYSYNLYCITLAINQLSDRNFYTRFRTRFFGAPEFTPCF